MPGCLSARQRPRSVPKGGFSALATDDRKRVDGQAQHDLLGTRIPEVLVIFTDEFPDLFTRSERQDHVKLPGLRECTWIFHGAVDNQRSQKERMIALDDVRRFGVGEQGWKPR